MRKDLEELAAHARGLGLYSTLVTSGLGLTRKRAEALREAGPRAHPGFDSGFRHRIGGADRRRELGQAEARGHRPGERAGLRVLDQRRAPSGQSRPDRRADRSGRRPGRRPPGAGQHAVLRLGAQEPGGAHADAGAGRARRRRSPEAAIERYRKKMQIIFVLPDYHEQYPKACYGGWGKLYIVVTPNGQALPCHAASSITSLSFPTVREHSLEWIWQESPGVPGVPRRQLDEGALPHLPAEGGGLRRLPVPGVRAHGRRGQSRSRSARSRRSAGSSTRRWRSRRARATTSIACSRESPSAREPGRRRGRAGRGVPRDRGRGPGPGLRHDAGARRARPPGAGRIAGRSGGPERRGQDDGDAAARHPARADPGHGPHLRARRDPRPGRASAGGSGSSFRSRASMAFSRSRRTSCFAGRLAGTRRARPHGPPCSRRWPGPDSPPGRSSPLASSPVAGGASPTSRARPCTDPTSSSSTSRPWGSTPSTAIACGVCSTPSGVSAARPSSFPPTTCPRPSRRIASSCSRAASVVADAAPAVLRADARRSGGRDRRTGRGRPRGRSAGRGTRGDGAPGGAGVARGAHRARGSA